MAECKKDKVYPQCGDGENVTIPVSNTSSNSIKQNIDMSFGVKFWDGFSICVELIKRKFLIESKSNWSKKIHYLAKADCEGLGVPPCFSECSDFSEEYNGSISEDCTIIKTKIFYLDKANQFCLYEIVKEELKFEANSTDVAIFKEPWSNAKYSMMKIKGAKIRRTSMVNMQYRWENILLFANTIEREPEWRRLSGSAEDVQQIIIFPLPAGKGIPLTPEVKEKGFYDYNDKQSGPELVKLDGGKTFFYPSWIRSMLPTEAYKRMRDYYATKFYDKDHKADIYLTPELWVADGPVGNAVFSLEYGILGSFALLLETGAAFTVNFYVTPKDYRKIIEQNEMIVDKIKVDFGGKLARLFEKDFDQRVTRYTLYPIGVG